MTTTTCDCGIQGCGKEDCPHYPYGTPPAPVVTNAMVAAGVAAMYSGAWTSDKAEVRAILTAALKELK